MWTYRYSNTNDNQKYNFSMAVLGLLNLENSLNLNVSYRTVRQSYAGRTWVTKKS